MRSTIESLIKLPLQIPLETTVRSKKEPDVATSLKTAHTKEPVEQTKSSNKELAAVEGTSYSRGYIKYPRYDFF